MAVCKADRHEAMADSSRSRVAVRIDGMSVILSSTSKIDALRTSPDPEEGIRNLEEARPKLRLLLKAIPFSVSILVWEACSASPHQLRAVGIIKLTPRLGRLFKYCPSL